ncbi:MAG: penicillin-binding protein 2, partial [Spirochaetia bacterium]|nr:penicillin-binding protein 2 [Spirochaetia bacterium]
MVSREKHTLRNVLFITLLIIILILVRLVWLIISQGASEKEYNNPIVASRVVRGTIYDRNGEIMAIETPYYAVALHLEKVKDLPTTITTLSSVINMDEEMIKETMKNNTHYALIKKNLLTKEKTELEALIKSGVLKGAVIEKRYGRVYPQIHHASQVIGFTNSNNKGLEGIEYTYNSTLSPYPKMNEDITYGDDVTLTLDMNIQYMLDINIREMVKEHLAESAVGIIMEAKTGAIVALSNYPWFDPSHYSTAIPESRRNSAVTDMREPGSVFKIFSLAAELDSGAITEEEHFYCDGVYTFIGEDGAKTTINCVSAHGEVDPTSMIALSCNGAVAAWSKEIPPELFNSYIKEFGFSEQYPLPLTG